MGEIVSIGVSEVGGGPCGAFLLEGARPRAGFLLHGAVGLRGLRPEARALDVEQRPAALHERAARAHALRVDRRERLHGVARHDGHLRTQSALGRRPLVSVAVSLKPHCHTVILPAIPHNCRLPRPHSKTPVLTNPCAAEFRELKRASRGIQLTECTECRIFAFSCRAPVRQPTSCQASAAISCGVMK
jgi:hypothetical protein